MKIKKGSSRMVIIGKKYAYKIPYVGKWKNFLWGLLANMQEVEFNSMKHPKLARIHFYIPLGFLVVMKKAEPLKKFNKKEMEEFISLDDWSLPVELKKDSFGYIDGNLVAIDYG